MNQHPAFGSRQLGALFASAPMTCIDVGSRGGPKPDLEPIAFAVDWVGFEPDEGECARHLGIIDADREWGRASCALLKSFRRERRAALWRAFKAEMRERLSGPG